MISNQHGIAENIVQHLRDGITGLVFVDTIYDPSDPRELVLVKENGGTSRNYPDNRQDATVQFLSRSNSEAQSRNNAFLVYNFIRQAEHTVVYQAAVGKTGSESVEFKHVNVIQRPFSLGLEGSWYFYSFNAVFVYFAN